MNEAANRGGMIIFAFCMIFSFVFFIYTTAFQPGPIDTVKYPPGGLTEETLVKVRKERATSTPEKIENGKRLFQVHLSFLENEEDILTALNSTHKDQTSEVKMFYFVSNGFLQTARNKYMYIPEENRWDIVHYLRSKVQNPAVSSSKEWDSYLHYDL